MMHIFIANVNQSETMHFKSFCGSQIVMLKTSN